MSGRQRQERTTVLTKVPGGSDKVEITPLGGRKKNVRNRSGGGAQTARTFPKTTSLAGNSATKGKNIGRKKKTLTEADLVWDSGLQIVNPPILIDVPPSLALVMRAIDRKIVGSVEFSIYVKADVSDIECIRISEDFYVPKQLVSGASVDYNEPPMDGFNAVIHKHPRGVRSFSGTDDEYINQNFTVSILWCDGEFVDATVNYDAGAGIKLQLEGYVYVDDISVLPNIDVSNISVSNHKCVVQPVGNGMQSFAEAYGYYAGSGGYDINGVPIDDDDLSPEENEFMRTEQSMLRCGLE